MIKAGLRKPGLLAATFLISLSAFGAGAMAEEIKFKDKAAFEKAVKQFLVENPQVVFEETLQSYRMQEERLQKEAAEAGIKKHLGYLTAKDAPSIGAEAANADITVVEFFDYNCGYCKRALPAIQDIVESDDKVRVVLKEMAILGPTSETAALWSLAANNQDKYFDYHVALMNHNGPKEEAELEKLAKSVGLDVEQMKKDATSDETKAILRKDMEVAQEIGAQGTPAFIIGTQFIPGYVDEERMKQIIAEERAKKTEDKG
ncbi:MAG: DsbA family protein [Micavibrio sp.]|nr:DsbA family protein [Micavibrio sp.]